MNTQRHCNYYCTGYSGYMDVQGKIMHKINLKQFCEDMIRQRIDAARTAVNDAQQAANGEAKSSAGDKYETARAMGHLQKEMYARQLAENIKELSELRSINVGDVFDCVKKGAFIRCEDLSMFIASGLGRQNLGGENIIFLSPNAPLAISLHDKQAGDQFLINGKDKLIIDIY